MPTLGTRTIAVALVLAALASCQRSPPPAAPAPAPAEPASTKADDFDVCTGSKPAAHEYHGILRNARCDQDLYISMASMAGQLGVDCSYCHAPHPTDPKKEDYPRMTAKKAVANWMSLELMQSLKLADGSPIKCKSCHTDEEGRPVAKILGNPRNPAKAAEWMTLVLVKKFVAADGSRLKCKSCHVGTPGTPEFQKQVILRTEQLPKHVTGGKGTPAF